MRDSFLLPFIILFFSCSEESGFQEVPLISDSDILARLNTEYIQLPEAEIARLPDGSVYAQYARPTDSIQLPSTILMMTE